jgi:hypothetical protein
MAVKQTFTIELDRSELFYAIASISWALDQSSSAGWANMIAFDHNLGLADILAKLTKHLTVLAEQAISEDAQKES